MYQLRDGQSNDEILNENQRKRKPGTAMGRQRTGELALWAVLGLRRAHRFFEPLT